MRKRGMGPIQFQRLTKGWKRNFRRVPCRSWRPISRIHRLLPMRICSRRSSTLRNSKSFLTSHSLTEQCQGSTQPKNSKRSNCSCTPTPTTTTFCLRSRPTTPTPNYFSTKLSKTYQFKLSPKNYPIWPPRVGRYDRMMSLERQLWSLQHKGGIIRLLGNSWRMPILAIIRWRRWGKGWSSRWMRRESRWKMMRKLGSSWHPHPCFRKEHRNYCILIDHFGSYSKSEKSIPSSSQIS